MCTIDFLGQSRGRAEAGGVQAAGERPRGAQPPPANAKARHEDPVSRTVWVVLRNNYYYITPCANMRMRV